MATGPSRAQLLLGLLLTLAGLVVAGAGMAPDLDGPWQRGWKAHNGGRYAHIARNYARWGFTHAGGAPVLDVAQASGQPASESSPDLYAHHPPGVMMLTGLFFRAFGVSERVARLLSFGATLASLAMLALLVGTVFGPLAGGAAALLCGAMPMTAVFGTHVEVQGPLVLLCGLTILWAYARLLASGGGTGWWLVWFAALAAGSWCDWFGLYYGAGCAVHALVTRRGWGKALLLGSGVAGCFASVLAWLSSLPGMSWRRVFRAAGLRVDGGVGVTDGAMGQALGTWFSTSLELMPAWPLCLGVVLILGFCPLGSRGTRRLGVAGLLWLLVLPPVVHGLLFPAGLLLHSYWLFAMPAALAAGLGVALCAGAQRGGRGGREGLAAFAALVLLALGTAGLVSAVEQAREELDPLPALLGQALAQNTAVGDGVLTNFEVNLLWPGMDVGQYIVSRPEISYYADRPIRGGVRGQRAARAVDLAEARRLLPSSRWFLLWPDPADPELAQALEAVGGLARLELNSDPPVLLYGLAP
ncbi:MAG: 4-amino-4-deoxy-L-arabinose transferase-like glycosyltransferase [Pseudohongiellaceae bacterium]